MCEYQVQKPTFGVQSPPAAKPAPVKPLHVDPPRPRVTTTRTHASTQNVTSPFSDEDENDRILRDHG